MDSVTQIVLGAAVAETTLGHKVGRKAMVWGAVLGTLPDLDVLIRYANPVDNFTYHRSFSHSIFVLSLLTPLIVWLILKIHPQTHEQRKGWFWLVWLVLMTHILLDAMTIYGTQLFWPFWTTPVGLGSIFIIDPLYTVPMALGLLAVLWLRRSELAAATARKWLIFSIAISTTYLGWSAAAQAYLQQQVSSQLHQQGIDSRNTLVTPAPFNTLLWRFVTRVDGGYYEGMISLLDQKSELSYRFYPSRDDLLPKLESMPTAQRLQWFTKGYYAVSTDHDEVIITDLRMGVEPDYAFAFSIAQKNQDQLHSVTPTHKRTLRYSDEKFDWIIRRISDQSLPLPVGNFGPIH